MILKFKWLRVLLKRNLAHFNPHLEFFDYATYFWLSWRKKLKTHMPLNFFFFSLVFISIKIGIKTAGRGNSHKSCPEGVCDGLGNTQKGCPRPPKTSPFRLREYWKHCPSGQLGPAFASTTQTPSARPSTLPAGGRLT